MTRHCSETEKKDGAGISDESLRHFVKQAAETISGV
jgi:hypothetical protein